MWKAAIAATTLIAASACSESEIEAPESSDGSIRFAVESVSSRSAAAGSASAEAIALRSADKSLYLIPEISSSDTPSRASATDNDEISSFGVFARRSDGSVSADYMCNVEVTRSNGWAPREKYRWLTDGTLHFNAYSPYADSSSDEGITSLPATGDKTLAIAWSTPDEVDNQSDLLYSVPVEASESPCAMTFNHALTGIRFAAGAELAPCTIREITISNILSEGSLDLESGQWTLGETKKDYSIQLDRQLTAAEGSQYVAPSTPITEDDEIFFLLPQVLDDNATITLTIESQGETSTFTASIGKNEWDAGKTITYRLSASPAASSLILQVLDSEGKTLSKINSAYTGDTTSYTVRSFYYPDGSSSEGVPVKWKASFIDADGNELRSTPSWISSVDKSGEGEELHRLATALPEPEFLAISPHTATIRSHADINSTSGNTPYNLANPTGASTVVNTANCYVINAPGRYSIPLVYGNAIKDGSNNTASYISTLTNTAAHRRSALLHFVNHLGNDISDPYISKNSGCTPAAARLLWEDRINLVRDVELSADGESITFNIPAASIRQGNAMLAVLDSKGDVMWSWHIWITDFVPGQEWESIAYDGTTYDMSTINLGRIFAGDVTLFPASATTMRLTQVDVPAGSTPLSVDIAVAQEGKQLATPDCHTYYQWGRKDAMIAGVDEYYNASHAEMKSSVIPSVPAGDSHLDMIITSIKSPQLFITGKEDDVKKMRVFYQNLWSPSNLVTDINAYQDENVKSVYDPCPVGLKVPNGNAFKVLADNYHGVYESGSKDVVYTLSDGTKCYYTILGYREAGTTNNTNQGFGAFWTCMAHSATTTRYMTASEQGNTRFVTNIGLFGFGIRPARDI